MAKPVYAKKVQVPAKPVMISRSSTTITMKLPSIFKPITDYKAWRNIKKMSIFGKPSESGVAVSLNNTEYRGTGMKVDPGSVITVSGLTPDKKYVFACAGYTEDGVCVNGIGETSDEILTSLPLNINLIYAYLAQTAYKLKHYDIARKAAENSLTEFIEKNEIRYRQMNSKLNPLFLYRIKYDKINYVPLTTIRQIIDSILIIAHIQKYKERQTMKNFETIDYKPKLRVINFLLLALELTILIKNTVLIKRLTAEIYDHLLPIIIFNVRPPLLSYCLLYCHQAIRLIPSEIMDSSTRKIGCCIAYAINPHANIDIYGQLPHEINHKACISELAIDFRKWRTFHRVVSKLDPLTEDELAKQQEQREMIERGEEVPEEELIHDPEPYDVTETFVLETEKEGISLENFLLTFSNEFTEARVNKWKRKLQKLAPKLTNGEEEVEKITKELDLNVSFWKSLKEDAKSQINSEEYKDHRRFLEFT
jgi:hypothetical protein